MAQKNEKKSWIKRQVAKVQFLPWYWKGVASLVIVVLGAIFGTYVFNHGSDLLLMVGFAVLVAALWFVIQLWWISKDEE